MKIDNAVQCVVLPGSEGEHLLQARYGRTASALAFYRNQVLDYLNPQMASFIGRQEIVFIGTADARGEADVSLRAGRGGFVRILDSRTLAYPEDRGNGVMASLGNIHENGHVGLLFIDFAAKIGLHVNGHAAIVENADLAERPGIPEPILGDLAAPNGRRPERWVLVAIAEAYVHCSKHIPRMQKIEAEVDWGSDDPRAKGGDYFAAKTSPRSDIPR